MSKISQRSGILLVDKPEGISSANVVHRIKTKHHFARVGHGGTLDPFATGLLVVLLGEATKVARFLLEGEKTYVAEARLGEATDTGDLTGTIVEKSSIPDLSLETWQKLATGFLGRSQQTPPAYSAIKVKGRALYDYARKGEAVEVKSREIQIREFSILERSQETLKFRVSCSGGTYIRVLAADLARSGGGHAHLVSLRRTESSNFRVEKALTLDQIEGMNENSLSIFSLRECLAHLPAVRCDSAQATKVRQGNLGVFNTLKDQIQKPGYFLLVEGEKPVAIGNHHPMLLPFCSIERVFDPTLTGP